MAPIFFWFTLWNPAFSQVATLENLGCFCHREKNRVDFTGCPSNHFPGCRLNGRMSTAVLLPSQNFLNLLYCCDQDILFLYFTPLCDRTTVRCYITYKWNIASGRGFTLRKLDQLDMKNNVKKCVDLGRILDAICIVWGFIHNQH